MLAYRIQQAVAEFQRNDDQRDTIVALECWKYEHFDKSQAEKLYRLTQIADRTHRQGETERQVQDELKSWLQSKDSHSPLEIPAGSGASRGGLRVILCDRPSLRIGMTMSYPCFNMIADAFNLHHATLPAFCMDRGAYSFFLDSTFIRDRISIIMKFPQKVEVANYILSLSYDISTGWTEALICGAGVVLDRTGDSLLGGQYKQLIDAILAAPSSWDSPFFLPFIMLDNYTDRLDWRAHHIDMLLSRLETQLGVTFVGKAGTEAERSRWPQDIDTQAANIDVQTISTQIALLSSCTDWSRRCLSTLLEESSKHLATIRLRNNKINLADFEDSASVLLSIIEGVHSRFNIYSTRAHIQSNVLFNIISQQESYLARQDTRLSSLIAKSSKRDSTSMIAFTFITALFLPGTFVATLFSMSMFDFNPDPSFIATSSSLSSRSTPGSSRYVSDRFWIFWAIALPLTALTMSTWYFWSRHATEKWLRELDAQDLSLISSSSSSSGLQLEQVSHSPLFSPVSVNNNGHHLLRHRRSSLAHHPLALERHRNATAGVHSKDEIRTWWKSPGQV